MIDSDNSTSNSARDWSLFFLEISSVAGMIAAAGDTLSVNMPFPTRINGDLSPSCFIDDEICAFTVAAGVAPSVS